MNTVAVTTQTLAQQNGLSVEAVIATVFYVALGVLLMVIAVALVDKIFGFNIKKELIKDHNVSVSVAIAGIAVAIAIIIAGTIGS